MKKLLLVCFLCLLSLVVKSDVIESNITHAIVFDTDSWVLGHTNTGKTRLFSYDMLKAGISPVIVQGTNGIQIETNANNVFVIDFNGTNVSVVFSNIITTNLTVINEFRGRLEITTNLFATNTLIQFLTNNFFYTTNVTEQFVTNFLSYITNLYGPFITNNNLYSTNIFTTNLFATYVTNNTDYITNLYGPFITNNTIYSSNAYITNLFVDNIVTNNIITNLTVNNLTVNTNAYITNLFVTTTISTNNTFNFITNDILYSTNIITTNLTANYITNNTLITTNLYVSNVFATNITVDVITNNTFVTSNTFTTNLFVSNIFTTNITLMSAIWNTNKWNGPTNDVSFKATYQKFVASTDMEITGLIDSTPSNANTSVLLITPGGSDRVLYFPAVFTNYTSDGNNAYLIPSTNVATVTLFQYGNANTNVVFRLFGPGTLGDTNFAYTDKNNAFTKTNYEALNFTTSTNQNQVTPDFSVPEQLMSTNAAFTFLAPVGVDTTKTTVQWTLVNVTNTTAAAVLITSPANCHTVGTAYVTNLTAVWFQVYAQKFTNAFYIPVF